MCKFSVGDMAKLCAFPNMHPKQMQHIGKIVEVEQLVSLDKNDNYYIFAFYHYWPTEYQEKVPFLPKLQNFTIKEPNKTQVDPNTLKTFNDLREHVITETEYGDLLVLFLEPDYIAAVSLLTGEIVGSIISSDTPLNNLEQVYNFLGGKQDLTKIKISKMTEDAHIHCVIDDDNCIVFDKVCNNCVKFKDLNFGDSFILANKIVDGILEKVNNKMFNSYRRKDNTLFFVCNETKVIKEENNKKE